MTSYILQFETTGKAAEAMFTTITSDSVFTTVESLRMDIAGKPNLVWWFSTFLISSYIIILSLLAFKLLFALFNSAYNKVLSSTTNSVSITFIISTFY